MAYNAEILLGRILKISGYEGAVTIKLENYFLGNIPHIESVFLEIEGRPVPFFIADTEYSGAELLKLKFIDYESDLKVARFIGCRVFLTTPHTTSKSTGGFHSFVGYKIMDNKDCLIGTVIEVIDTHGQLLMNLLSPAAKEILIPLHEDFIVSVDKRKKILFLDLPEGLTELN
jgi:16S rRNA processing protein RimM